MFEISLTPTAADHIRADRRFEQKIIFDAIDEQLPHEPLTETRNRKRLGENPLFDWELRVQDFRVFYDVVEEDDRRIVKIKAVGLKVYNTLIIGGKEGQV